MTINLWLDKNTRLELGEFLGQFVDDWHEQEQDLAYCFDQVGEIRYELYINDDYAKYLRELDHDCTISPEDGCSFCSKLQELGILPDFDGFDYQFYGEDEDK